MDVSKVPAWLGSALKSGGVLAALVAVWFLVAAPMREDFRDFRTDITAEFGALRGEVRNLSGVLIADIQTRLARAEERLETDRAEINLLRQKTDGGK